MQKKATLKEEDRNFFSLVVKSIYMNPFCDEWLEVVCQISPNFLQDRTIAPELNDHKTTLIQKIVEQMRWVNMAGFYTAEIRCQGSRITRRKPVGRR